MTSSPLRAAALSAAAFAALAGLSRLAVSQDGAAPAPAPPGVGLLDLADASTMSGMPYPEHVKPQAHYPQQRRSVVHHYPYPYPGYYHGERDAGFRDPEGRGRYAEFYTPEDTSTRGHDPTQVASFAKSNGAPDRNEQIAAYNAGTQRYNSIQRSIDSYARPYWGMGFGVGGFGGFW
ncbi:MAG: hypothetical protein BGO49_06160 [Planctomycetales bacterium 71-10]|nr:MAG: hypothetical protein BGO49_06160 [Planctomycetales bacterium 71-10]